MKMISAFFEPAIKGMVALLSIAGASVLGFIVWDAHNAYDGNPFTPTLSSKLRAWRDESATHKWLLRLGISGTSILGLVMPYLTLHLWLDVI
jgi:hypothetical protein